LSELGHSSRSPAPDVGHNVVLTGFMGTGKTTVGRLLAADLGFEFVDTDALIEQRHGPIPEIFAAEGEEAFRKIERAVAAELANRSGLVISTGGRMMLDPDNVRKLSANGRVFCLVATPEEVYDRVTRGRSGIERPLLQVPDPRQRIVELMSERDPEYRRFPQLVTDARTPRAVARDLQAVASSDPHTYAIEHWQLLPSKYKYEQWLVGGSFIKYRIFANGTLAAVGPFRPIKDGVQVVHEYDVTSLLKSGPNSLAVLSRGEHLLILA
jgi:shikimate kinase